MLTRRRRYATHTHTSHAASGPSDTVDEHIHLVRRGSSVLSGPVGGLVRLFRTDPSASSSVATGHSDTVGDRVHVVRRDSSASFCASVDGAVRLFRAAPSTALSQTAIASTHSDTIEDGVHIVRRDSLVSSPISSSYPRSPTVMPSTQAP